MASSSTVRRTVAALSLGFAGTVHGQAAPLPMPELFAPGAVLAIAALPDGALLVGGEFTLVDGVERRHLARLGSDGRLDPAWRCDADARVEHLALSSDGTIYASGDFRRLCEQPRPNVGRITAAGVLLPFNPRFTSSFARVERVVTLPDATVLIGGGFEGFVGPGGQSFRTPSMARLRPDGTPFLDFAPDFGTAIGAIAPTSTGDILAGGPFSGFGDEKDPGYVDIVGLARVRLDGSLVREFDLQLNQAVSNIVPDGAGGHFFSGNFTRAGGQTRSRIAHIDAEGRVTAFAPSADGPIDAIAPDGEGGAYLGGRFQNVNGQTRRFLARVDALGRLVPGFDAAPTQPARFVVRSDSEVVVGGEFRRIGGSTDFTGLVRLGATGSALGGVVAERGGNAFDFARHGDGVLVAGNFRRFGNSPRGNVLRLRPDLSLDPDYRAGTDGAITAIAAAPDGRAYLSGSFFTVDGTPRLRMARLRADGTLDPAYDPTASGSLEILHLAPSGFLYAFGGVLQIGGEKRSMTRLDPDGRVDASWTPSIRPGSTVTRFLEYPGSHVLIGGLWTEVSGEPIETLARVDYETGAVNTTWRAPITSGPVYGIEPLDDGSLLLSGTFTEIDGQPRNRIASIDATSGALLPLAFNLPQLSSIRDLERAGNDVFGTNGRRVVRFDVATRTGNPSFAIADSTIGALLRWDPYLLVGGFIVNVNGVPRNGFAVLSSETQFANGFESF